MVELLVKPHAKASQMVKYKALLFPLNSNLIRAGENFNRSVGPGHKMNFSTITFFTSSVVCILFWQFPPGFLYFMEYSYNNSHASLWNIQFFVRKETGPSRYLHSILPDFLPRDRTMQWKRQFSHQMKRCQFIQGVPAGCGVDDYFD